MLRSAISRVLLILRHAVALLGLHVRAFYHGQSLSLRQNNLNQIGPGDLLLFSVMKDEAHRLSFFIDYYRKLGVDHFIFVDNGSSDHFSEVVENQSDISVFYTDASYRDANFGMHWANSLLRKYGSGHWCITCDPDEFLVYPNVDERNVKDLCSYLGSRHLESLFTPMVDMYSKVPVEEAVYKEGTDPLDVCSYFDRSGYVKVYSESHRNAWCQGGVRRRVFFADQPQSSPAINKYVLVKWQWHFAYVQSMHMAVPRRLNEVVGPEFTSGAVLHFKFISQLKDKVDQELVAKQHFNESAEYRKYGEIIENKTELFDSLVSTKYEGWETLVKCGLMNRGEW